MPGMNGGDDAAAWQRKKPPPGHGGRLRRGAGETSPGRAGGRLEGVGVLAAGQVVEAQGRLILGVMLAAVKDLGLAAEIEQTLRPAIARHLRQAADKEWQRERPALATPAAPGEG